MSNKNRGDRIQLLHKVVIKHFKPVSAPEDRTILEHLVYACCLEDASYEAADEAFHRLQESYFDWNEVRVTTVSELCEVLHNLPDPAAAAVRIKKNLQSIFETRYSFDLDDMIKMNQGKAVQELEKLSGMTKFVLGYVTQTALAGHSIPVSTTIMYVLRATEIVSEAEADKGIAPGLERTIPKTKGTAFSSCLHQLAITVAASPNSKLAKTVMKEAGAADTAKSTAVASKTTTKKASPAKASSAKTTSKKTKAAASKTNSKKPAPKSGPAKKQSAKKTTAKKSTPKKTSPKKAATKTKRKPR